MSDNIIYGHSGFWLEAGEAQGGKGKGKTEAEAEWERFYRCYAATVDVPACLFFAEAHTAFPAAHIILSTRSAESWYKSCSDTIFVMQPGNPNQPWGIWLYQQLMPFGPGREWKQMMYDVWDRQYFRGNYSKENAIKVYNSWIDHVKKTCETRGTPLLIHEGKEGWEPLCAFLHVPVPDCPYPNVNDSREFQKVICKCVCVCGGGGGGGV